MARYAKVSIPADLFEEVKKAHEAGYFEGRGFRSPSDAICHVTRKLVEGAKGAA